MRSAWILLAAAAAACGGSQVAQVKIEPPPAPATRATLVGPLCADGQTCTCRDEGAPADGGAGEPGEGLKRFELVVGPAANAVWVTVDDMVLYKSEQRATECFYIDLPPGDHKVGVRAHQEGGLGAAVRIREYGAAPKSWYDTISFACGSPGACSNQELDQEKTDLAQSPHGVHDLCGSVKVKGLLWQTGREPDAEHPEDLAVELTLKIYKRLPDKKHGDPTCAKRMTTTPDAE
jgi:hypothetical protein